MKKLILLLLGLFPIVLGYLMHYFINITLFFIIYVAVWIIWFLFGMLSIKLVDRKIEAVLLLNSPALFFLLLALYQQMIVGRWWPNIASFLPQIFYVPFSFVGFRITLMFHQEFDVLFNIGAFIASFTCMLIVSFAGRFTGEHL